MGFSSYSLAVAETDTFACAGDRTDGELQL